MHGLPVSALLAALVACSSPNPNLYTIAPVSGATQTGAPKVIALRQIGVARYLERSQIVRSSENYRLDVMSNDWWGEPLGAMLGARAGGGVEPAHCPTAPFMPRPGAVSVSPDATIELNVSRLDLNASGVLVLQAQAAITMKGRGDPLTQSFHFDVPPTDGGCCRRGRGDQHRGRPACRWTCDYACHGAGRQVTRCPGPHWNPNSPGRGCMNARAAGCCRAFRRWRLVLPRNAAVAARPSIAHDGIRWSTAWH